MTIKDTREVIRRADWGVLRQGILFRSAAADGYVNCDVSGLIVTAQCDLAHDKAPIVNFVPVVRYKDWLERDCALILARRIRKQELGVLRELLKQLGHSPSVLDTETISTVVESYFGDLPKGAKTRERAERSVAQMATCEACLASDANTSNSQLATLDPKATRLLVSELFDGRLSGYYFLPAIEYGGSHDGYVVLLRQVYHLPKRVALQITDGATRGELAAQMGSQAATGLQLTDPKDELVIPVGALASPYLEHAMQAFGLIFTRIGVTDLSDPFAAAMTDNALASKA